jgi:hypothetical protein
MFNILASSVLDGCFEPRSGQIKVYYIVICCFSTKHATLRSKSRLVGLESGWCGCVEWHVYPQTVVSVSKNPTEHVGLVHSGHHYHFIECNLFSPWYSWKIAHLAFNNNHSLPPSRPILRDKMRLSLSYLHLFLCIKELERNITLYLSVTSAQRAYGFLMPLSIIVLIF